MVVFVDDCTAFFDGKLAGIHDFVRARQLLCQLELLIAETADDDVLDAQCAGNCRHKRCNLAIADDKRSRTKIEAVLEDAGRAHRKLNATHGDRHRIKQRRNIAGHIIRHLPHEGAGENVHILAEATLDIRRFIDGVRADRRAAEAERLIRHTVDERIVADTAGTDTVGQAVFAGAADDPRIQADPIAELHFAGVAAHGFRGVRPHFDHAAAELMTKNDGICRILFEQMKIGAADAGGLQLDNHAVAAAFRTSMTSMVCLFVSTAALQV